MERPHESAVVHISTSRKNQQEDGATKKTRAEGRGTAPILVTSGTDRRLFIFRLIRVAKTTKLEPIGFILLDSVPERIEVKSVSIE